MEQFSQEHQRLVVEELNRCVAERDRSEASLQASHATRDETAVSQFDTDREGIESEYKAQKESYSRAQTVRLAGITNEYEQSFEVAKVEHDRVAREIVKRAESAVTQARQTHQAAGTKAEQEYEQEVQAATQTLHDEKSKIASGREELEAVTADLGKVLRRRRCRRAASALDEAIPSSSSQPAEQFQQELAAARTALAGFSQQRTARFVGSGGPFVVFIFTWILAVVIGTALMELGWPWVIGSGAVAFGVAAIVYVMIRPIVIRQTLTQCQQIRQHCTNGHRALDGCRALAVANADQRRYEKRKESDLRRQAAEHELRQQAAQVHAARDAELKVTADELQSRRKQFAEVRSVQLQAVNEEFEEQYQQLQAQYDVQREALSQKHGDRVDGSNQALTRGRDRIAARWSEGISEFEHAVELSSTYCMRHFPDWKVSVEGAWAPPTQAIPVVRFGEYSVRLKGLDERFNNVAIPAVQTFAGRAALLWESWGDGRDVANCSIRNVMLRLLTSLPPGKTRFTIIDPIGLGQNFSAFMHLADFDEKLVSHRIWTEPNHINQRLADLTGHMEDIIQTYLRNEYETIDQYNKQAGEVAEPFHILAVANFPAAFSDEAAARLLSIVNSGVQCGVFALVSTDSRLELPRGFELADLEAKAVTLQWNGQAFRWLDPVLQDFDLKLDEPPDETRFTEIVCEVGKSAQEANRVEVPFSTVAPKYDEWWSEDSRSGVRIPLGRAGATKFQHLQLGKGTSQHVLISGKTGSGKSTLLHALIVNTALHYSPDEVQFYLIDFKKGVEFKPYAEQQLPHASVVAIESEREFGISVLERLDRELQRRGDLFREHGVQDIRNYRDTYSDANMPRLMLIIDEFQELFVQDDKLAQDAALLLDRLVRQGRAFGIHVLLGSQTLAGAYSLARSTIGQMAVRIALQCSEADSHLILSEDNTAARLLDRPGEAIYNDQNGLFEGNHPFQVVWLPAPEQDRYLRELAEFTKQRGVETKPPIVFEGNAPADPAENVLMRQAVRQGPADSEVPKAWLGSAVAIKEPTAVHFRRQSGSNLAVVGQQETAAVGLLASAVVSLAATGSHGKGRAPRFVILDGSPGDAATADTWKQLAERLPVTIDMGAPNECTDPLTNLHIELQRRLTAPSESANAVFLMIFNLSRFRDLRRADDDFGFGSSDGKESLTPAQQLTELLREGPVCGIHVLIWCDTFNNLNRWFDRPTLRELDHRVLFQMSATDSSNLMDSPAASKLGRNRALLFSEEQGVQEKFRPYRLPTSEWLEELFTVG
jgi:S-DNA-T family DNA segregation ATPase FtsK/SpoIIIE